MANGELMLSHIDIVKAVITHQDIHEGCWCLNINFNVSATHGGQVPDPCVALSITGIGIMRADRNNPMAVDASVFNPAPPPKAVPIQATNGTRVPLNGSLGSTKIHFGPAAYRSVAVQSAAADRDK
ncbi:hypothetical protein [Paraburkholderia sp.]|uniref:hypothetical protein n=1 Tax=Paraburkholderia sp. TaxID=1926495 RepID=UPI0023A6055B|nr:hypothetical protein [Paraburkholderia sp.]MDE1180144.1 hypothetical protein [Paraburkholderia sp.]